MDLRPLAPQQVSPIIRDHVKYVESDGRRGNKADLSGKLVAEVPSQGVGMKGANLRGIVLRNAALFMVDLDGTDLTGADLRGADLRRAKITDSTILSDVLHDASTRWPPNVTLQEG